MHSRSVQSWIELGVMADRACDDRGERRAQLGQRRTPDRGGGTARHEGGAATGSDRRTHPEPGEHVEREPDHRGQQDGREGQAGEVAQACR